MARISFYIISSSAISSGQADLLSQLDQLGTNLLTVAPGQQLGGGQSFLPQTAPGMIRRIGPVLRVSATGPVPSISIRKTDKIPSFQTGGIPVRAADLDLPGTLSARVGQGAFLDAATAQYPAVVLGASTAQYQGIADVRQPVEILMGDRWFTDRQRPCRRARPPNGRDHIAH